MQECMNIFITQLNRALNAFDAFSRVHSPFSPFCAVKYWGHWTDHDDLQVTMKRFDHVQFPVNTCLYGTWSFSCMVMWAAVADEKRLRWAHRGVLLLGVYDRAVDTGVLGWLFYSDAYLGTDLINFGVGWAWRNTVPCFCISFAAFRAQIMRNMH